jgi:hypothetical protein
MANTYVQIGSTVTVGSGGAATIDFTSIPSTYTDLLLKLSLRDTSAAVATQGEIRFNSDASTIYSNKRLRGNGTTATSYTGSSNNNIPLGLVPSALSTANTFCNAEIYIPNYAGSNNKSVSVDFVGENNATEAYSQLTAGLYATATAITSISIINLTLPQYSTATLYGIKKN